MEEQRRKAKLLRVALGMMGIQTDNKTAHKIALAVELVNRRGHEGNLSDVCAIESEVEHLYKNEEDEKDR